MQRPEQLPASPAARRTGGAPAREPAASCGGRAGRGATAGERRVVLTLTPYSLSPNITLGAPERDVRHERDVAIGVDGRAGRGDDRRAVHISVHNDAQVRLPPRGQNPRPPGSAAAAGARVQVRGKGMLHRLTRYIASALLASALAAEP